MHLMPWVFALDHVNYARWLSIHIRDMSSLPNVLPSIYREFSSGRFVAHKTMRPFSAIALDQAHEQVNAMVKGDGGAVGLTGNASALRRWMIAGPELSRMIQEFEGKLADGDLRKHHQQISSYQVSACKEVKSMVAVLTDMGNPFAEDSGELLRLDTKDIMSAEVVQSVRNLPQIG